MRLRSSHPAERYSSLAYPVSSRRAFNGAGRTHTIAKFEQNERAAPSEPSPALPVQPPAMRNRTPTGVLNNVNGGDAEASPVTPLATQASANDGRSSSTAPSDEISLSSPQIRPPPTLLRPSKRSTDTVEPRHSEGTTRTQGKSASAEAAQIDTYNPPVQQSRQHDNASHATGAASNGAETPTAVQARVGSTQASSASEEPGSEQTPQLQAPSISSAPRLSAPQPRKQQVDDGSVKPTASSTHGSSLPATPSRNINEGSNSKSVVSSPAASVAKPRLQPSPAAVSPGKVIPSSTAPQVLKRPGSQHPSTANSTSENIPVAMTSEMNSPLAPPQARQSPAEAAELPSSSSLSLKGPPALRPPTPPTEQPEPKKLAESPIEKSPAEDAAPAATRDTSSTVGIEPDTPEQVSGSATLPLTPAPSDTSHPPPKRLSAASAAANIEAAVDQGPPSATDPEEEKLDGPRAVLSSADIPTHLRGPTKPLPASETLVARPVSSQSSMARMPNMAPPGGSSDAPQPGLKPPQQNVIKPYDTSVEQLKKPVLMSAPARGPPPRQQTPTPEADQRSSPDKRSSDSEGPGSAKKKKQNRKFTRGDSKPYQGRVRVDTLGDRDNERKGNDSEPRGGRRSFRNSRGGQSGVLSAENRRKARKEKKEMLAARREGAEKKREEIFEVPSEGLTVAELADVLAVNAADVVKALFMKGIMAQVNQQLDLDTVRLAAAAFGAEAIEGDENEAADGSRDQFVTEDDLEHLQPRPPVVCVMGHVDHGKTSLLDKIRQAAVAEGEAGGITQAIGAYNVHVSNAGVKEVCFLDTPGHEAFSAMRARGAQVTDIAIIIVAADDGVRPQTLEAVAHARAAGVPMVVAINKIDKPGADVDRVRGELAGEADLVPEQWGGSTPFVSISAKKGDGIDELLETVALVAELEEFQANPLRAAEGTVLEAHLDNQVGPIATLLVQAGTLKVGDMVQAGVACGRVRRCSSSLGEEVSEAVPSTAVSVVGLDTVPAAGDVFKVFEEDSDAREAAQWAKDKERKERLAEMASGSSVTLSTLATVDEEAEALQRMNLVVKADASGSLEAVKAALQGLPQDSVALRFLLTSTGPIQPSDIELAVSSKAYVIGFNSPVSEDAAARAKQMSVNVKTFDVIYALLDFVRGEMEGCLKSVTEKVPCGTAEVKALFGKGKNVIGGCLVTDGKLISKSFVEVKRGRKNIVYEGELTSLRRFKDEVSTVEQGVECGVGCKEFWEWEEGDKIQCYELVEKTLSLEESKADSAVGNDLEEALAAAMEEYERSTREESSSPFKSRG